MPSVIPPSTSGLSLLKVDFYSACPSSAQLCPRVVSRVGPGRRLTLEDPTLSGPRTNAQALYSTKSFLCSWHPWSSMPSVTPGASWGTSKPLLPFFTSRILPGRVRPLSFRTRPRAHSAPLTDQRTLIGSRTLALYTRLRYGSSGEKGSLTSISLLSFWPQNSTLPGYGA